MASCRRCGNSLSSNGYCHICLSYDMSAPDYDIPTPKSYIYEKYYSICKQSFSDKKLQDCPVCHSYFHSLFVTIQPPPNQLANIDFDVIGTSDY